MLPDLPLEPVPPGTPGSRVADAAPELQTKARAFASALLGGVEMETGEPVLLHADGACRILSAIGADAQSQAAAYLSQAATQLAKPEEQLTKAFGRELAVLAMESRKLVDVFRVARGVSEQETAQEAAHHQELMRRLLLAFSQDLRVVMLRLASRLQSLRYYAGCDRQPTTEFTQESLEVYAPLANRLGLWSLKWEIEDLAFRFAQPQAYARIARWLEQHGAQREALIAEAGQQLRLALAEQGHRAQISGRSKHIYSIWRKMQGKSLGIDEVMDLLALRIIVPSVDACYAALSTVHSLWTPVDTEYDDYIAKPKPNGYQSLHTVVHGPGNAPIEIQIRTQEMHDHAEQGFAAHWAYKEAGVQGYRGVLAASEYDAKIALARQLLSLQRELVERGMPVHTDPSSSSAAKLFDDRIYVLTPQARIVELASGSTPVDFAYAVHTDMGHRCRGARVDGALVPLTTPLRSGQTVDIVVAKQGGPSRDWLNPELGFLQTQRARAKVRAWFNAQVIEQTLTSGRAQVEKLLQREGKTGVNLQELAAGLGFRSPEQLFERVGSDALSLRQIETHLRGQDASHPTEAGIDLPLKPPKPQQHAGVLVVGVDALLTQLAKCCKPAPPDAICGFVTRGRGVSVHRVDCPNARNLTRQHPERVIPVTWGVRSNTVYPVDLIVEASDRQGLLRDISEVFSKEKINVIGVQTQSRGDVAHMLFTVELLGLEGLQHALGMLRDVKGVRRAARR
ncbi:(P)ppGpp synthetase I, SpoT/RelA [Thiomonas sp. X19]|uniref:RelA/SpoT family protein n=1 Tax=Thiomonas sp. X19 TaxID=1050370 RepID=UPI000B69DA00|nr:bifunctional (p)ppGpp synthetase/guanosine-3',5'-bis(diphosphate) 3'-pyrophosphohydrolase [Thiomonas sp. X19]SCC94045.1 (P)ppGpp synthetase I, SpoT/RelA [Thiomonas sp. X19]